MQDFWEGWTDTKTKPFFFLVDLHLDQGAEKLMVQS